VVESRRDYDEDMSLTPAPFPPRLLAAGVPIDDPPFQAVLAEGDLPAGAMRRVSVGDLDVLLAHTDRGVFAVDDRCPHMAAPLSIGELDGCIVACPLHEGRFDLSSGDPAQMPTTGGLDPDGVAHPSWSPAGRDPKVDPPGKKAEARRLTRIRRFRYYPVRVREGSIEIALPVGAGGPPVPHLHLDGTTDHD
jgi:3-phenylpropionate/trans-cinnamate dioxygenase ferredoxin subunit